MRRSDGRESGIRLAAGPGGGMATILVVETTRPSARCSASSWAVRLHVVAAESAEKALEFLDVVAADLILRCAQGAMSGIELCERVKATGATIHAGRDAHRRVRPRRSRGRLAAGADDFFSKPVDFAELRTRWRRCSGSNSSSTSWSAPRCHHHAGADHRAREHTRAATASGSPLRRGRGQALGVDEGCCGRCGSALPARPGQDRGARRHPAEEGPLEQGEQERMRTIPAGRRPGGGAPQSGGVRPSAPPPREVERSGYPAGSRARPFARRADHFGGGRLRCAAHDAPYKPAPSRKPSRSCGGRPMPVSGTARVGTFLEVLRNVSSE